MNAAKRRPDLGEAVMPSVVEALDSLRVAITVFDSQERLSFANQHINYLFRSLPPRAELSGGSYADLLRQVLAGGEIAAAETQPNADSFVERYRVPFRNAELRPMTLSLADGRSIEIKTRRTPSGGWIILWSDVTDARQVLGRLRNAIELSADSFAFYDRNDALVLCNQDYASAHSADSPDQLVGKSFLELATILSKNGKLMTVDDGWLERRIAVHRQPAGVMMLEASSGISFLLRDRATADGGRAVVLTDVTEHRRVEQALVEQTRTLDRTRRALARTKAEAEKQSDYLADLVVKLDKTKAAADSAKTTLLRTMSHELKTPLNAIIGFSDLLVALADRHTPADVKEYAALINQGGKNLLRLINEILDLTKISAGRYDLRRQRLDAGAALSRASEAFETLAGDRGITIASGGEAGLMLNADESALTTMLNNLVENAVLFNDKGGEVRLSAVEKGTHVRLSVADNGPGVSADDLERILLPFEQVGRGTSEHTQGTGLGLTLVKALAELHGGSLVVESNPGSGFTAHLDLPAA
ncbi:MAG: PAS-domain containing protein [Alphaproteobacteria bacterium]|nr:PAS-domain containing protein [Alphaproteobacteria bacterium]